MLQDNAFRPILRISSSDGPADSLKRAKLVREPLKGVNPIVPSHFALQHTAFPTGLLRGALARLGLQAVVVAEITSLPQCKWIGADLVCTSLMRLLLGTFQVKLPKGT